MDATMRESELVNFHRSPDMMPFIARPTDKHEQSAGARDNHMPSRGKTMTSTTGSIAVAAQDPICP